jgi:alanine racemase
LIRGKRAPVIGVVCMDLTMVDVTEIPGVKAGDEVVLIGKQGKDCITVEEVAEKIGTISYEVFCRISQRVPRIYRKDGRVVKRKYPHNWNVYQ